MRLLRGMSRGAGLVKSSGRETPGLKLPVLITCCLLFSSCALAPRIALEDRLTTDDGVLIEFNACATPTIQGGARYQMLSVVLTVDGRRRTDPKFDFAKDAVNRDLASAAQVVVRSLSSTFKWACPAMSKESGVAGRPVTPRDEYLLNFHYEAFKATVDTALRIEREATDEGYQREIARGRELIKSFRDREPDSWDG